MANHNQIFVGSLNTEAEKSLYFDDNTIDTVNGGFGMSLIGAEMQIDTMTVRVRYKKEPYLLTDSRGYILKSKSLLELITKARQGIDWLRYGTPVWYYSNGSRIAKMYLRNVVRESKDAYTINCISAVGLWDRQAHKGGMYYNEPFKNILAEMLPISPQRVDYVENEVGAYIDTGVPSTNRIETTIKCQVLPLNVDGKRNILIMGRRSDYAYEVSVFETDSGTAYMRIEYGTRAYQESCAPLSGLYGLPASVRYDMRTNHNIARIITDSYSFSKSLNRQPPYTNWDAEAAGVTNANILFFGNGNAVGRMRFSEARMYDENDVLIRHFVACSDRGVGCIYERITHQIIYPTGGKLKPGNLVINDDLQENYIDYIIDDDVANTPITGWLPYDTVRNNMHQLTFANGISCVKSPDGKIVFKKIKKSSPIKVDNDSIYAAGSVDFGAAASDIEVTEHQYYAVASAEKEEIYNNTEGNVVEGALIKFSEPVIPATREATGITIHEMGVNYAIISGRGTVRAAKYRHQRHVISKHNDAAEEEKTVSVSDAYCVNASNGQQLLLRLFNYYAESTRIKTAFAYVTDEKCGDNYSFENAFGEMTSGYMESMDIVGSTFVKGECEMVSGFVPVSDSEGYNNCIVLTGEGTWTVPEAGKKYRYILIGGGFGGAGGTDGEMSKRDSYSEGWLGSYGTGAAGGKGGTGGMSGRVYEVEVDETEQPTYAYSCGTGGRGGLRSDNPRITNPGMPGTATVLESGSKRYTSDSGSRSGNGWYNVMTNETYALPGMDAPDGGKGGDGGHWDKDNHLYIPAEDGENVYEPGGVYHEGQTLQILSGGGGKGSDTQYDAGSQLYAGGAGAGGAYGNKAGGGNGTACSKSYKGGQGGYGKDAKRMSYRDRGSFGCGGAGGPGGGGGGGDGQGAAISGEGNRGGNGADGLDGIEGCIVIMY